jgi:hypothetical protein
VAEIKSPTPDAARWRHPRKNDRRGWDSALHDDEYAVGLLVSLNLKRRHLNESQRASVAAKIANLTLGANQHQQGASANLQTQAPISQAEAAELLNVSPRSVTAAKAVQNKGTPDGMWLSFHLQQIGAVTLCKR